MKENQRITVTKRMLKEGLLRLLEVKPLDKIRVSELCGESGINRATFYRHYQTPQDVLLELELDMMKQIASSSKFPNNLAEAQKHLENACTYIYEHSDIARILFRCNADEDMMRGLNGIFRYFWELRKEEPQFAHMDEDTARIIAALLGGGCYCLLRQWILEDIKKTPQEIAAIISNVIRWPASADFLMAGAQ